MNESSWVAVRVRGRTGIRHACREELFAHSAPVYLEVAGDPVRKTSSAPRFIDQCADLRAFCNQRGFDSEDQRVEVFAKIQEGEDFYRAMFVQASSPFSLLLPGVDASASPLSPTTYVWEPSDDPEEGDRVVYRWELRQGVRELQYNAGTDTFFVFENRENIVGWAEWRVVAADFGGNAVVSDDGWRPINFDLEAASVPEAPSPGLPGAPAAPLGIVAAPNPSGGQVSFALSGLRENGWLAILDAVGRRVREFELSGSASRRGREDAFVRLEWDGRTSLGTVVPAGVYWATLRTESGEAASCRIVRTR